MLPFLRCLLSALKSSPRRRHARDQTSSHASSIGTTISHDSELLSPIPAIYALPPEVLAQIFEEIIAQTPSFVPALSLPLPTTPFPITGLSRVCRHWYSVTQAYPQLWTYIDDRSRAAVTHCLKKSKSAPLKVFIHEDAEWTFRRIHPHLKRVQELHIQLDGTIARSEVLQMLQIPSTPLLRSLTILYAHPEPGAEEAALITASPKLRQLALSQWPCVPVTGLTHFCWSHTPGTIIPTSEEFAQFLRASPHLEELVITDCAPHKSAFGSTINRVALRSLRHLRLASMKPTHAARILAMLDLPDFTTIRVWDLWWDWHNNEEVDLSSCLPDDLSQLPGLRSMTAVRCVHREGKRLQLSAAGSGDAWLDIKGPISSRDHGTWDTISLSHERTLKRLPTIFLGQQIREIWIGNTETTDAPSHDAAVWRNVLSNLPNLTNLVIFHTHAGDIVDLLSQPAEGTTALACPLLQSLRLVDISDTHLPALVKHHLPRLVRSRTAARSPSLRIRFVLVALRCSEQLEDLLSTSDQGLGCVGYAIHDEEPQFRAFLGGLSLAQERALSW